MFCCSGNTDFLCCHANEAYLNFNLREGGEDGKKNKAEEQERKKLEGYER